MLLHEPFCPMLAGYNTSSGLFEPALSHGGARFVGNLECTFVTIWQRQFTFMPHGSPAREK